MILTVVTKQRYQKNSVYELISQAGESQEEYVQAYSVHAEIPEDFLTEYDTVIK